jgi:ketosteroid isomerase-like protein
MKMTIPFLLITLAFAGCGQPQTQATVNSANETLVKQYFGYFNAHDWVKLAGMYAETADFKDPSLGEGIVKQTRQQTIDKYTELANVFPSLHDEVVQVYPSDDQHIIVELVSTGTAADGSTFKLPICSILTIEKGVITKDYTYFDNFDEQKVEK